MRGLMTLLSFLAVMPTSMALALDDFEDGTTQDWGSGGSHPSPPSNVANDGPLGAGDNYLRVQATGSGAGGKLVFFKSVSPWAGNWTSSGYTEVRASVANFGSTTLSLRLAAEGPGGWWSTSPVTVSPGTWQPIVFNVTPGNFSAANGGLSTNLTSTLAAVGTVRIVHGLTSDFRGDNVVADTGFDGLELVATSSAKDWLLY